MSTFNRVKKYRKPLVEIDKKIDHLREAMTTSGLYNTGTSTDALPEILPTYGEIGDQFLGDFSDTDSFTQNADNDNVDQLSANDDAGISTPINSVMDTSSFNFASGVSALAMARQGRHAQGVLYGFIDSRNVFNEIFTIGGNAASGRGQSDIIDAGLDWWEANVSGKTIVEVPWKCYNLPHIYDSLYPPHETGVGPAGNYNLHTNQLLFVKNQNFNNDNGQRKTPAKYEVLTRNDLGDPNYYAGNVSPEALNYLIARSGFPRNAADFSTMNVRGPHQPVRYFPGMGFAPVGPVRGGPGGFEMTPQPALANSFEPEGEVLSEDLTKNDFARLNKYVKDHPEELEYAFKRYPASDPRLSQLNYKMDQMVKASNDYVDKQFPENIDRTSRVKKILARNIELSDPKTFKDVKQPATYGKVFGNDPKNKRVNESDPNVKSAARFFRKPKPKTKDQVREERLEELRQLENKFSNK